MALEAIVVSAGFAATLTAYMGTNPKYQRYSRYNQLSLVLLAAAIFMAVLNASEAVTNTVFGLGWTVLIGSISMAVFSAEIAGLNATIRHRVTWYMRYSRIARWLGLNPDVDPIGRSPLTLPFLASLIRSPLERGACVAIKGRTTDHVGCVAFQIVREGLVAGENIIFVNTQKIPSQVYRELNLPDEHREHFFLIDFYTPTFGLGEIPITGKKERYTARTIRGLHTQIRNIRIAIGLGNDYHCTRLVYDNPALLATIVGEETLINFIMHSLPVEVEIGWVSAYVLFEEYADSPVYKLISSQADIVLSLSTCEEKCSERKLRVERAQGAIHDTQPAAVQLRHRPAWEPGSHDFVSVVDQES